MVYFLKLGWKCNKICCMSSFQNLASPYKMLINLYYSNVFFTQIKKMYSHALIKNVIQNQFNPQLFSVLPRPCCTCIILGNIENNFQSMTLFGKTLLPSLQDPYMAVSYCYYQQYGLHSRSKYLSWISKRRITIIVVLDYM